MRLSWQRTLSGASAASNGFGEAPLLESRWVGRLSPPALVDACRPLPLGCSWTFCDPREQILQSIAGNLTETRHFEMPYVYWHEIRTAHCTCNIYIHI